MNPYIDYKSFLDKNLNNLSNNKALIVVSFYKFFEVVDKTKFQSVIKGIFNNKSVKGTILIANEGINGTICGLQNDITLSLTQLWGVESLLDLQPKYSLTNEMPFFRMKIKLKKEIVTLGVAGVSPTKEVGEYLKPEEWNDFISDETILLIDTRNNYEVSIGTFENAVNPNIKSFRDFPKWVSNNLLNNKDILKNKKIGMFCTGGIRCEKSTSYLKSVGFDNVFHLEGGILKYLEKTPEENSKWNGSCFVFDYRVSVKHDLKVGDYDMCFACRMPINDADKSHNHFIQGESCHHCYNESSFSQKKRFNERQKQIELSKARNESHIGSNFKKIKNNF